MCRRSEPPAGRTLPRPICRFAALANKKAAPGSSGKIPDPQGKEVVFACRSGKALASFQKLLPELPSPPNLIMTVLIATENRKNTEYIRCVKADNSLYQAAGSLAKSPPSVPANQD